MAAGQCYHCTLSMLSNCKDVSTYSFDVGRFQTDSSFVCGSRLLQPGSQAASSMPLRPSLEKAGQELSNLLVTTVETPGSNSSFLLIGARGLGKSLVMTHLWTLARAPPGSSLRCPQHPHTWHMPSPSLSLHPLFPSLSLFLHKDGLCTYSIFFVPGGVATLHGVIAMRVRQARDTLLNKGVTWKIQGTRQALPGFHAHQPTFGLGYWWQKAVCTLQDCCCAMHPIINVA